jgi:hypothetical protein
MKTSIIARKSKRSFTRPQHGRSKTHSMTEGEPGGKTLGSSNGKLWRAKPASWCSDIVCGARQSRRRIVADEESGPIVGKRGRQAELTQEAAGGPLRKPSKKQALPADSGDDSDDSLPAGSPSGGAVADSGAEAAAGTAVVFKTTPRGQAAYAALDPSVMQLLIFPLVICFYKACLCRFAMS